MKLYHLSVSYKALAPFWLVSCHNHSNSIKLRVSAQLSGEEAQGGEGTSFKSRRYEVEQHNSHPRLSDPSTQGPNHYSMWAGVKLREMSPKYLLTACFLRQEYVLPLVSSSPYSFLLLSLSWGLLQRATIFLTPLMAVSPHTCSQGSSLRSSF